MNQGALILTEAGKDIGFGHYTRCAAIREKLAEDGVNVQMVIFLNDYDLNDEHVIKKNWLLKYEDLLSNNSYSLVLIDSYLANETIYKAFSQTFKSVIAIDDYNRIFYTADYILNPNVFFSESMYENQSAKCLGGKDYVILRKEFRKQSLAFNTKNRIENILITIGGSDFRKIQPLLIETCLKWDISKLNIISPEGIFESVNDSRLSVLSSQNAVNMVKLMEEADLVISACGQTLHELTALGKPTIGICLDIDQLPNQDYYLNTKFLLSSINWNDDNIIHKLNLAFEQMSDLSIREKIKIESSFLINKNGVEQVVTTIKKLL